MRWIDRNDSRQAEVGTGTLMDAVLPWVWLVGITPLSATQTGHLTSVRPSKAGPSSTQADVPKGRSENVGKSALFARKARPGNVGYRSGVDEETGTISKWPGVASVSVSVFLDDDDDDDGGKRTCLLVN